MKAARTKTRTSRMKPTAKKGTVAPAAAKKKPASRAKTAAKAKPSKSGDGKRAPAETGKTAAERWNLRLYVAGQTPRSLTAFANLKRLCEERLAGRYLIEVIDLVRQPQLAQSDQIIAIPT